MGTQKYHKILEEMNEVRTEKLYEGWIVVAFVEDRPELDEDEFELAEDISEKSYAKRMEERIYQQHHKSHTNVQW